MVQKNDIFSTKTIVYLLLAASISSGGLGISNFISDSEESKSINAHFSNQDNRINKHIATMSNQITALETQVNYIEKNADNTTQTIKELTNAINELRLALCSNSEYKC